VERSATARGCGGKGKNILPAGRQVVEQGLKMRLDFLFLFDQAKRKGSY
jgi:hypothetical protein